jgi:hypothetical protein
VLYEYPGVPLENPASTPRVPREYPASTCRPNKCYLKDKLELDRSRRPVWARFPCALSGIVERKVSTPQYSVSTL